MCILYSSSLTVGVMCISSPFFSSLTEREKKKKKKKSWTPPEAIQKARRTIYENVGRRFPINMETAFGRPPFFAAKKLDYPGRNKESWKSVRGKCSS